MTDIPYHIQQILKENKISDFLKNNSVLPSKKTGDKLLYLCPLHEGDTSPSLVVYINNIYENFYCYGCKKGGNIINLVSDYKNISLKQAVSELAKDLDIDVSDVLEFELKKIINNSDIVDNDKSIEEMSLCISLVVYNYLLRVNFNKEEIIFFEKVLSQVDDAIISRNKKLLFEMKEFLIEKGIPICINQYNKKQERLLKQKTMKGL